MTPERQGRPSRITAPTLVIHGTDDPLLPLANGQALAALIPSDPFEAIPGMGRGLFSPGIPTKIARLILDHTAVRPWRHRRRKAIRRAKTRI
jgi:pimeloyl-ACP methyl ester carboxylesterase